MDDEVRRCAHTGCDVRIVPADGRPRRRYCTAAHRLAARQARRAAQRSGEPCSRAVLPGRDARGESLPWLREPEARVRKPGASTARPATAASTAVHHAAVRPRRRRTLALLGAASVLAGGYAASVSRPEPSPVPVQAVPAGESPAAWAQRATVALASVNRQLDTLVQAEEEWKRQADRGRAGRAVAVGALQERRSVLQRQRDTLRSQLEAYRSLRMTQQSLAVSERHLQSVEKALAAAPPGRRSAEQAAALAALDEQRDLRLRHSEAQRTELTSLQEGVATAVRTPLPDDEAATAEVSRNLRDAARPGGRAPEPRDAHELLPPEVVAGRQHEDGKPREEPGVSGPPDPRGPRGEGEERREATQRPGEKDAARGALDQLPARVAEAAKEARRAEMERKAAAEHSAHRADDAGRTGSRKSDRSDEADDDRIEERNADPAAEQAEAGAGRTRAQRESTDQDRSSGNTDSSEEKYSSEEDDSREHSFEKERSSGKKRLAEKEKKADTQRSAAGDSSSDKKSDRERSSRTKRSSDEERSSPEQRTADEERSEESHR